MAAGGKARRWAWCLRRIVAPVGVEATAELARGDKKPSGCMDTGVASITDRLRDGVSGKDAKHGEAECRERRL